MEAGLTKKEPPPGMNVILGDNAGSVFLNAFQARDRLLIDQDVLSCGPTPKFESFEAWARMRLDYWNSLVEFDRKPYENHTHSVLVNLPRLRNAERVNIWFATSLSEQLCVAFTVYTLDTIGADVGRVYLIPFENLHARPRAMVRGMGELSSEQMANHPDPVPLSSETLADYRAAWAAMMSEDPRGFERFASERPNASASLKRAMQIMLRRFPDRQTGLFHWDRILLGYVGEQPRNCVRIVVDTMDNHWDEGDFVGDYWLFARVLKMGEKSLPKPLLTLTGSGTSMAQTEAVLTPFGKDVLDGRVSNYPTNPLEDWAAGVKLSSSAGNLWFNDGGRLVRGDA